MNYIFLKDSNSLDRVIRTRYPVFVGTIKDDYSLCLKGSKVYKGKKICIDELLTPCPDSKLEWACKQGLKAFFHNPNGENIKNDPFSYIRSRRRFLNITSIEEESGISRSSLTNAINRKQNSFGQSEALKDFLDNHFTGWSEA